MRVLVDTTVWSEALRRKSSVPSPVANELARLVRSGAVEIIGPIRQEILSGIRDHNQFERLRERLTPFADLRVTTSDFIDAASHYNLCMAKGVQATGVDMLICTIAIRDDLAIFTLDNDFQHYARALPIKLHTP